MGSSQILAKKYAFYTAKYGMFLLVGNIQTSMTEMEEKKEGSEGEKIHCLHSTTGYCISLSFSFLFDLFCSQSKLIVVKVLLAHQIKTINTEMGMSNRIDLLMQSLHLKDQILVTIIH